MAGTRKLLSEIDRTLKKVNEGFETFDAIWDKVYSASQQNQKEKYESDLKKEIKKLQRFREQLKVWIANNDVKDKRPLIETRKQIEHKMEQFKICERETKTKAYSKEGLAQQDKLDPNAKAKQATRGWIQDSLSQLNEQMEGFECDLERLARAKGKRQNKSEIMQLRELVGRHDWHVLKLEQVQRMMDNDVLEPVKIDEIKDDVEYYLEANQEPDFMETYGNDDIYEVLNMDSIGASLPTPAKVEAPVAVKDVSSDADEASKAEKLTISNNSAKLSISNNSRGRTSKVSANPIVGIGRPNLSKSISGTSSSSDTKSSNSHRENESSNRSNSYSQIEVAKNPTSKKEEKDKERPKQRSASTPKISLSSDLSQSGPPLGSAMANTSNGGVNSSKDTTTGTAASVVDTKQESQNSRSMATKTPAQDLASSTSAALSTSQFTPNISVAGKNAPPPAPALGTGSSHATADVSKLPICDEQRQVLQMLDASLPFLPEARDSERSKPYIPRNPYPTSSAFPNVPAPLFENPSIYEKFDVDTLFFIFYYQQGTYQQYLAARELKKQTWAYHKKYMTWFKRHEEPKVTCEEYEQGTYVYFDYETGWCQRIKSEFTFEYSYLEDELSV